jgi:hypothetical protein
MPDHVLLPICRRPSEKIGPWLINTSRRAKDVGQPRPGVRSGSSGSSEVVIRSSRRGPAGVRSERDLGVRNREFEQSLFSKRKRAPFIERRHAVLRSPCPALRRVSRPEEKGAPPRGKEALPRECVAPTNAFGALQDRNESRADERDRRTTEKDKPTVTKGAPTYERDARTRDRAPPLGPNDAVRRRKELLSVRRVPFLCEEGTWSTNKAAPPMNNVASSTSKGALPTKEGSLSEVIVTLRKETRPRLQKKLTNPNHRGDPS